MFDKYGINSFWERSFDSDKLQVINNVSLKIINKLKNSNSQLVFVNENEYKQFLCTNDCTADIESNVHFIDDYPELMHIGLKKYYVYDSIQSVPNVKVLGYPDLVFLSDIILSRSENTIDEKKIISLGGKIIGKNLFLRDEKFSITVGNNSKLIFGDNCRIGDNIKIVLEKDCTVEIGDNCNLCNGTTISSRSASTVKIGNNCVLNNVSIDTFCHIELGNNCLVAPDVSFRDGDGHDILGLDSPNYPKPIIIGNNVWLGKGTKILKGVEIKDNCIIGTGSIISKNFSQNQLIAGVPAKVIKKNINWRADYSFYREMQEVVPTHQWPFI